MANLSEIRKESWRKRKRMGGKSTCAYCHRPIYAGGVLVDKKPMHKTCAESYKAGLKPTQVGKNPKIYRCPECGYEGFLKDKPFCGKCGALLLPKDIISNWNPKKRGRVPRNGYKYFGATPLNPAEYVHGPTGFRPPAKWFSIRAEGAAASYFGKKLKDLTKKQKDKVGQIVGGIWAKFSDRTRMEILKKYEPSAVPANPRKQLLKNIRQLPCPICKTLNPVNRTNTNLRCIGCGTNLIARRVKKRRK